MMELLVDFVAARLMYEPVPVDLLDTLALVLFSTVGPLLSDI